MANNWKFGLGLLAGAAAGYWLNTAEGRRFRKRAQGQLEQYSEQAGQYLAEASENVEKGVSEYLEKSKAQTEKLKNNLASGAVNIADAAEEKVDELSESLKRGIRKAKASMPQHNENGDLA